LALLSGQETKLNMQKINPLIHAVPCHLSVLEFVYMQNYATDSI